jgi:hypothetical protein
MSAFDPIEGRDGPIPELPNTATGKIQRLRLRGDGLSISV